MNTPIFHKELKILSTAEGLELCLDVVKEIEILFMLDTDKILSLQTVVVEAVENAIIHGNKTIRDLFVRVSFSVSRYQIIIEVEDQGEGFDVEAVPSPLLFSNLRKESGRGIFFIKGLSSECYTLGRGNIIHIIIDR